MCFFHFSFVVLAAGLTEKLQANRFEIGFSLETIGILLFSFALVSGCVLTDFAEFDLAGVVFIDAVFNGDVFTGLVLFSGSCDF